MSGFTPSNSGHTLAALQFNLKAHFAFLTSGLYLPIYLHYRHHSLRTIKMKEIRMVKMAKIAQSKYILLRQNCIPCHIPTKNLA